MQTIIMTVGTSLRTNQDNNLSPDKKRPWFNQKVPSTQRMIQNKQEAIKWMIQTEPELISAETNTLWQFQLTFKDEIILLYSDTESGLECAEILKEYFESQFGLKNVTLRKILGINYELDESGTALEKMAKLLQELIHNAQGDVTLAATGGFKAQTMIMALVGNALGVNVCYIHEEYRSLIYLPYLSPTGEPKAIINRADLPESGRDRETIINIQHNTAHHRPKSWPKVEKMLKDIPWVDAVRFDKNAFSAPKNWFKVANRPTPDGRFIFWIHLCENDIKMAVSVESTGYKEQHLEQAARELRERLGNLF